MAAGSRREAGSGMAADISVEANGYVTAPCGNRLQLFVALLMGAIISAFPARAQLLSDIIDHPASLPDARSEAVGKRLRTSAVSLPVFAPFTGIAVELTSSAEALSGRVRIEEASGWSDWIPLHFVRSFTEGVFIAGFHGERVWSSTVFELEIDGPADAPVVVRAGGVFDNRNDADRIEGPGAPGEPVVPEAPGKPEGNRRLEGADLIVPPSLITRTDWDAEPFQLGNPVPLANPTYDWLTFHHAAGYSATTYEEGLAQVKAIQDLHQNVRGWSDIGYQFVIDRSGRVYQGRPFLDASTTLAQEPVLALGAHVGGYNSGNIGICMLGCYHPPEGSYCTETPTAESLDAYVTMFAFLSERYGPDATAVRGHRDWSATACPGDTNYALLPQVRTDVATLLVTGNQAIAEADLTAVPQADGFVTVSWTFVADFGVERYSIERTFNGMTSVIAEGEGARDGSVVDPGVAGPGTATYELFVTAADGRTQRVDVAEAEIGLPDSFRIAEIFPNPAASVANVRFYLPYQAFVRVALFDGAGREVRMIESGHRDGEEWVVAPVDVSALASGVYYYRVLVEGFSGTAFDETRGLVVLH